MEWVKSARVERFELYNLEEDLDESENLSGKEPKRLKTMAAKGAKMRLPVLRFELYTLLSGSGTL